MGNLVLEICGERYNVLETPVKDKPGRTWHVLRYPDAKANRGGVKIEAGDTHLPASVTIDGVKMALEAGVTESSHAKRSATKTLKLPSLGEERRVTVIISDLGGGVWNVIAKAFRNGGGGSVSPEQVVLKAASLKAA